MLLENTLIMKSIDGFLRSAIADAEDLVSPKKMQELEMTRLVVTDEEDCYTTGKTIVIGKEFPVFSKEKNNILYRQTQGVVIHELAHIFFTNFKDYSHFINTAPQRFKQSKRTAKSVINILEDYRIERKMVERNQFYQKLFLMVRFHIIDELSKKMKEYPIKNDSDRLNVLINSLLFIGFIGHPFKTNDAKTNQMMMALVPLVRKATQAESTKEVALYAEKVMQLIGKLDADDQNLHMENEVEKLIGKLRGKGTNSPVEKQDVQVNNPGGGVDGDIDAEETDSVTDITKSLEEASVQAEEMMDELGLMMDDEISRIERDDITGEIIDNYFNTGGDERTEKEIEDEEEEIKELKKELPPLHSRKIIKVAKSESIEKYSPGHYETLKDGLRYNIKKTLSRLEDLKQIKIDDWEYYQKSGTLDTDSLIRFSIFDELDIYKTQYPEEEKLSMDVMLLVDCSGSNSAQVLNKKNGERLPRYKINQMIALFIHEVLKGMEWRHSVWAFDSGRTENITPIVPFTGCFDKRSGLKIRNIGARNANRDGLHIRMAGKHLAGHAETERKLLIVLSDGQPASDGYHGEAGMKDVYDSTQELKELGVKTIGIFSGDPSENKYFGRTEQHPNGMYENHIFLNNDSISDFPEKIYELLVKEFELEDQFI